MPNFAKEIFSKLNLCLTSNFETKDFLLKLNAPNILYTGNIKLISSKHKDFENSLNEDFLSTIGFGLQQA